MFDFWNKSSRVSLLIDIGSGSTTAALVLFEKDKLPTFLFSLSKEFSIDDRLDSHKLIENMPNTLDFVLSEVAKSGFGHSYWKTNKKNIYSVLVSFSSPWYISKTKHIQLKVEKPFVVNESYVNKITLDEQELFKSETANEMGDSSNDTFKVIESSIVHIKINGYVINSIVGHKINELDAYICMSIVNSETLKKVDDLIAKYVHIDAEKIITHSFPLISFASLRDIFNNHSNFLLFDVTSEVTDITLVFNDIITQTVSIPTGRNYIIRKIAQVFNCSNEIAESTLGLFSNQKADKETTSKIENVLLDIEKEWTIYLEKALLDLSPEMNFPSRIYLTCESDITNIYSNYIKLPKADATSVFRKNADIVHIDSKTLSHFYVNDSHTEPDEFILLIAIFYNKFVFA